VSVVFVSIPNGGSAGSVLRTGLIGRLLDADATTEVVLISPLVGDPAFVREFEHRRVRFEDLPAHRPAGLEARLMALLQSAYIGSGVTESVRIRRAEAAAKKSIRWIGAKRLLAQIVMQMLERFFIAVGLLQQAGQNRIDRRTLESDCIALARRVSRLYGLNAPEFFDARLFHNFVETLIARGAVSIDADGKLAYADVIGEDMELIVRLHRTLSARGARYRVAFVPDPVCWTDAPEDFGTLARQHDDGALRQPDRSGLSSPDDLDRHGVRRCLRRFKDAPDRRYRDQRQNDRGNDGPDDFDRGVAVGLLRLGIGRLAPELENRENQRSFDQNEDHHRPLDRRHEDVVDHGGEIGLRVERGVRIRIRVASRDHQHHEKRKPCPEGRTGNDFPEAHVDSIPTKKERGPGW